MSFVFHSYRQIFPALFFKSTHQLPQTEVINHFNNVSIELCFECLISCWCHRLFFHSYIKLLSCQKLPFA